MSATDQLLAQMLGELQDRQQLIDGIVQDAHDQKKELEPDKLELIERAKNRISDLNERMKPLEEARRISGESADRIAQLAKFMSQDDKPTKAEYRSAGEYVMDRWRSGLGQAEATHRLDLYHRAAAHQTTADNAGLIPTPILGPVINFIDQNRALVTQLGPRQLPGQTWTRPKVTQHTTVAVQPTGEKNELVSQKMLISKLTGTAGTYGGYVNVSRQDIDFTQPGVLDIVINDLAAQFAIQTEAAACTAFDTAATAGIAIATGAATAAGVATSLWDAVAKIYTATKGAGRVFAVTGPDMLSILAPLYPPVNPQNAISTGLSASDFGTGLIASLSGIPLYVSGGVGTLRILVFSSAAAEVYEDRIGSLQVVEPSVLGLQVAYAGYFTPMVVESTGIVKIVKTP